MNDFLGRHAEWALHAGSQVRPRLPSLFEPTAAGVPVPLALHAEEGQPEVGRPELEQPAQGARPETDDAINDTHRPVPDASRASAGEPDSRPADGAAPLSPAQREATAPHESELPSVEGREGLNRRPDARAEPLAETARVARRATHAPNEETGHAAPSPMRVSGTTPPEVPARGASNTAAASNRRARQADKAPRREEPSTAEPGELSTVARAEPSSAARDNSTAATRENPSAGERENPLAATRESSSAAGREDPSAVNTTPDAKRGARQSVPGATGPNAREGRESAGDSQSADDFQVTGDFLRRVTARGLEGGRGVRPRLDSQTDLRAAAGLPASDTTEPAHYVAETAAGEGLSAASSATGADGAIPPARPSAEVRRETTDVDEVWKEAPGVVEVSKETPDVGSPATAHTTRAVGLPVVGRVERVQPARPARADMREPADASSQTAAPFLHTRADVEAGSPGAELTEPSRPARADAGPEPSLEEGRIAPRQVARRWHQDAGHEPLLEEGRGAQPTSNAARAQLAAGRAHVSAWRPEAPHKPPAPRREKSSVRPPRSPQADGPAPDGGDVTEAEPTHEATPRRTAARESIASEAAGHETAKDKATRETTARAPLPAARGESTATHQAVQHPTSRQPADARGKPRGADPGGVSNHARQTEERAAGHTRGAGRKSRQPSPSSPSLSSPSLESGAATAAIKSRATERHAAQTRETNQTHKTKQNVAQTRAAEQPTAQTHSAERRAAAEHGSQQYAARQYVSQPSQPHASEPRASQPHASRQADAEGYSRRVVSPSVAVARSQAVAPAGASHRDSPARRPDVEAPSVVRVTIGRVEVRAVMAPAPPAADAPRPARKGPALSLEDYLEQRGRGRR